MAKFHVAPGLEQRVVMMIAPHISEVARQVEREAKRLAPPGEEVGDRGR
ncbi:hypothetical protein AB0F13_23725 [Streptomyces sp. NPDC026206]